MTGRAKHNAAWAEPAGRITKLDEFDEMQRFQLDALDEEYRRRYGAAVEYLKTEIGPGEEYSNDVARVLISPNGAWFECIDLPLEFSGAAGVPVSQHFVADAAAISLLAGLVDWIQSAETENTREIGLLALYDRSGISDARSAFAARWRRGEERPIRTIGAFQENRLPRAFRSKFDTDLPFPVSGLHVPRRGLVYCLAGIGDRNLVVTVGFGDESVRDLGDRGLYGRIPQ